MLKSGYPCLSLHGGKEQADRECTIVDFKTDVCNVLVATSVAARGLDVKDVNSVADIKMWSAALAALGLGVIYTAYKKYKLA